MQQVTTLREKDFMQSIVAKYQKYDNYDAINVDRIKDIPSDYDGVMGVPLTFFDIHNPEQFEIVGHRYGNDGKDLQINGVQTYCRVLIKRV